MLAILRPHCSRLSRFARAAAAASVAAGALACSAPPGASEDDVPAFTGGPTGGGLGGTNSAAGGSVGSLNTGGSGVSQGGSQSLGGSSSTPAGGSGGSGAGGSQDTGGSQNTGGSLNVGGSGGGSAAGSGGQSGSGNEPVGPTGCGGATLFCEDFEGLALGTLQAGILTPERTVTVAAEAGRGQVLQIQATPGYNGKAGVFLDNFTPPNNSFFGRMFVRVAQFPQADGDHWVLVEATGAGSSEQVRPVGGQFQRWAPGADGPSAGDWTDWQQSNAATAAGQWECVEWQMNGANGGNDITLWVNDQQVTPTDRGNFAFPTVNRLWIGWVVYQTGQPGQYDVRIDDIVLSNERVGCD